MSLELKSNGHQNNLKEVKTTDPNVYEFEEYVLDASHLMLCRRGGEELAMTPKQVETLLALVERRGEIVAIDVLMNRLWPNAFVEESNLIQNIHILRKTLGKTADGKPMIETLRRRGYRFNGILVARPHAQTENERRDPPKENAALFKFPTVVTDKAAGEKASAAEAPSRTKIVAAVAAVLLLAVTISAGYYLYSSHPAAAGDRRSIAVLPLKPIHTAGRDEIYEMGIADSLILRLGTMKGLLVRPLSATRRYVDIEQDPIAAGKEQQADYVLASNYQLADGKIRITSQLFNVASGQIEETYKGEKDAKNLFAMQDAIAGDVASLLQKRFVTTSSGPKAVRGTDNEEAYRLYVQGTVLAGKRKNEDIRKAIECFEQAVRLDPNYALAYAELANVHSFTLNDGGRNATEGYLKAKAAIEKALAIDPDLAEAHSYLGEIKADYEWDFAGAEREHKRAVELSPNSSSAHCGYALLLGVLGRFDESIREMKTAIDLEPASAGNHHAYGWLLFQARRYDEAITEEQRVVEMDPGIFMAYNVLTNSYSLKGDHDKAFESFVQMHNIRGEEPEELNSWKAIYARSGWRGISERQLEKQKAAEKKGNPNYANLAGISIELGQNEQALDYLEKAIDQNRFTLITLKVNPRYDPLRSNPRFDDLVRRVGLK